jgi:hypothetical protein
MHHLLDVSELVEHAKFVDNRGVNTFSGSWRAEVAHRYERDRSGDHDDNVNEPR